MSLDLSCLHETESRRQRLGARLRRQGLRGWLAARGGGGVLLGQGFACYLSCLHETESRRRRLGARLRRLGLRGRLAAGFVGGGAGRLEAAAGFWSGRASLAVSLVAEP
ncbi:hypothetical protein F2Q69_00011142 [Brassica cretica]|uniref:Uncharacterized protein n=1 Tax=Brassica cretica TaxID=69181 RepID=A0A8S9QXW4_BRACR|nr:hypothetical protein F2Q69_00011142 [Brassica cretica]